MIKTCPSCGKEQTYANAWSITRAIADNAKCKRCVFKGRPISEKQKQFLSKTRMGKNNPMFGRKVSLETKLKMSQSQKKIKHQPLTEKTKRKLRQYRCEWIIKNGGGPQYNPLACEYFNQLNKKKKWNLRHALNGGEYYIKELGYWIDAYDEKRNIVVEFDEKRHFNSLGNLKTKDIKRHNHIFDFLQCKFYRYNQPKKILQRFSHYISK